MKIIVLGGMGHIGSYLVPQLVQAGHQLTVVSRGHHQPYTHDPSWQQVRSLTLDRKNDPDFAAKIAAQQADVVIDLIAFTLADTQKMVAALATTNLTHYLFCSSVWAHGRATILPADPNGPKHPIDEYGREKYASEQFLKTQFQTTGFPATVIMPGQISGPGWTIISPWGNENPAVFQQIADGQAISLPNFGMETLHLVHAADVAQVFVQAIAHRDAAIGQSFHAVAATSLTTYGYAQTMYDFFDQPAQINFAPWSTWSQQFDNQADIEKSYLHLARSGQYSLQNTYDRLDYHPRFTPEAVATLAVQSYLDRGIIHR